MITIISAIVGLLGSFLPTLLNYLTAKQNNNYQLELVKLQMKAAAENTQLQIDLAQNKADIEQQQLLYSYDNGPSGNKFIDAMRSSVRPVITYTFFIMWIIIEFVTFFYALHQGRPFNEIVPLVWSQNTEAIFVVIVGFWFGSRLLDKYTIFPPINQPKTEVVKK